MENLPKDTQYGIVANDESFVTTVGLVVVVDVITDGSVRIDVVTGWENVALDDGTGWIPVLGGSGGTPDVTLGGSGGISITVLVIIVNIGVDDRGTKTRPVLCVEGVCDKVEERRDMRALCIRDGVGYDDNGGKKVVGLTDPSTGVMEEWTILILVSCEAIVFKLGDGLMTLIKLPTVFVGSIIIVVSLKDKVSKVTDSAEVICNDDIMVAAEGPGDMSGMMAAADV